MLKNLSSNSKLFYLFYFSTVKIVNVSTDQVKSNLEEILNWLHYWNISLYPDPKKQKEEVIISKKRVKDDHPRIFLNNAVVQKSASQKLQRILQKNALLTLSKFFIRPLLVYGNTEYDASINDSFGKKLTNAQYNSALAICGVIKGTPREKLYKELEFE